MTGASSCKGGVVDGRDELGAHWDDAASVWRFALWAPAATTATVEVVDRADPATVVASQEMVSDGGIWRATLPGGVPGGADLYGFRVDGPFEPAAGHRFDVTKVLLDPYAVQVVFPAGDPVAARDAARARGTDTAATAPRGVLRRSLQAVVHGHPVAAGREVVYETHVRGFTRTDASVDADRRGTYAGLSDRLAYLAALGVTVIELLPVHAADPGEGSYWGYMPLSWMAVNDAYAATGDGAAELADLCAAAADVGIAIWLDVVYNHSTEEDEAGPTYQLRGLADGDYYVTRPGGAYLDDAGCGNILRAAHPIASDLVVASLDRLADLGVTGFRFDLASILGRDADGVPQERSELCDRISLWADERGVRLIAEAWDVASYQLGQAFPGRDWAQWNGRFRDDVRGFLRGGNGLVPAMVQRVQGSPDLFPGTPAHSVNFVDAHDGFTLYDLVSYDRKHNEANGWNGTDGTDDNRSWNCGVEGDDGVTEEVLALRRRQIRNALTILHTSAGVPMFVAGDEFGRTQRGNNNAYNQDNEVSWVDWSRLADWSDLHRFTTELIALRQRAGVFARAEPWGDDVTFFGADGPLDGNDWSRSLGWHLHADGDDEWAVIANAWWEPLDFALPGGDGWRRVVDTSLPSPDDIVPAGSEVLLPGDTYRVGPRSCVVLWRRPATSEHWIG
jgi:glycogen operon protein